MWYYIPTKNKLIYQVRANSYYFFSLLAIWKIQSNIFLFHPLGPFPSKMMGCPWILCFDFLPLQYIDLTHQIWRVLVYIFLALGCRNSLVVLKLKLSKLSTPYIFATLHLNCYQVSKMKNYKNLSLRRVINSL